MIVHKLANDCGLRRKTPRKPSPRLTGIGRL
jgi:hypothetical protein